MELRQLRYFVAIVEGGSLLDASKRVHIAQPALSQQIAKLEQEIGHKLLQRTARGVLTTKVGEDFYRSAKLIIRNIDQAMLSAKSGGEVAGIVSLGMTPSASLALGLPILLKAKTRAPSLKINIVERLSGHVYEMTQQGLLDAAIMFDSRPTLNMEVQALGQDEMVLIGSQPMYEKFGLRSIVDKKALACVPLILSSTTHYSRRCIDNEFTRLGINPIISEEIDSVLLTMDAVVNGLGFAIRGRASSQGQRGQLRSASITDGVWTQRFHLHTTPASTRTIACGYLIDVIHEVVADLIEAGTLKSV